MMNNTQSNVIGSKTSRSCDSCLSKRALWFCAADDAFLCQSCDKSVHSANPLATRHKRVRLEKAPSSYKAIEDEIEPLKEPVSEFSGYGRSAGQNWMKVVPPIWDQGITKKPRTPRSQKPKKRLIKQHNSNPMEFLVPEFDSEELFSPNENEEQLLNSVPVLDDLLDAEISKKSFEMDDIAGKDTEFDLDLLLNDHEVNGMNIFPGFMSTEELVFDVENYLGTNIKDDSCGYRGSYEIGFKGEDCYEDKSMKVEEENHVLKTTIRPEENMARESLSWDFEDYSSSSLMGLEEELKINDKGKEIRRINLKVNHEAIICAWDCQSSPWMNGIKPDFNLKDCWPEFMGSGYTLIDEDPNGRKNGHFGSYGKDEEREARVLRYKEKRRTRLFAKKIRYQVRKLNAEKRPRMKGRFVKRTNANLPLLDLL